MTAATHRTFQIPARRLTSQQIARHAFPTPKKLVAWLGAVQAQDYGASKWALGLRLSDAATEANIERAVSEGTILRTHALRWTWQFVVPDDVRWMLALVGPRLVMRAKRRDRQLELDELTFRRTNATLEKALSDGRHLTRAEIATALEKARISTVGQRLSHLLARAELDQVICSGARRGKQSTYALLDDRVPKTRAPLSRDEALAELARRYFRSRGPATLMDFTWWSGLTALEARVGLASIQSTLVTEVLGNRTYFSDDRASTPAVSSAQLLPAFDEYLVAYRDRDAVLDPAFAKRLNAGGGMLDPCVVLDGQVIGTWRRSLGRTIVSIEIDLFEAPTAPVRRAVANAAERYGAFVGLEPSVAIALRVGRSKARRT